MQKLFIKTKGERYFVPKEAILYMKQDRRKVRIVTTNDVFNPYGKVIDMANQLDCDLYKLHKYTFINLDNVLLCRKGEIVFKNDAVLKVGRDALNRLKRDLRERELRASKFNSFLDALIRSIKRNPNILIGMFNHIQNFEDDNEVYYSVLNEIGFNDSEILTLGFNDDVDEFKEARNKYIKEELKRYTKKKAIA